ncbi:peptidoglycan DD-metalloendopeptidase family protein [Sulfurimonas aquatica]|uniref:Peptidoglycan DD-metalloendopeptidase family protein n=1 Tax=Sulfurimonas aquatica TaxID=2672570 RepID=A0A975AZ35_9BACT|nr:M23 family metallopeptidase [Sulfurimonas aquatica]QSZ41130.1 peptidoglycan DD-metalloendopeptidase family protein [Sulfurimonas aquatica]
MDNHFTVTIHDDNGVKQFNIHHIVKKALLYLFGFVLIAVFIGVGTILYLNASIKEIQKKRNGVELAYKEIKESNLKLQEHMERTNSSLIEKKEELDELSDSLSEIEMLIGLKPSEETSIHERVSDMKLDSEHRVTLLQLIPNGSPVEYRGITSKYGYRTHPTLNKREFHRGTDMKAAMNTPVYAPADAIVEYAGMHKKSGFGRLVILEHALGFKTYFGHLKKVVIKSGEFVKKGTLIAYTGSSGMSNGPHLHYEIRFIHKVLNPFYFIKWTQQNYDEIFQKEKKVPWQSLITATTHLRVLQPTQTQPLSQLAQKSKVN